MGIDQNQPGNSCYVAGFLLTDLAQSFQQTHSNICGAGTWVDMLWTPVDVTPGTTYYLVFTGNTTLGIAGEVTNPFPNGMVYANPGYSPYSEFDYAFRTCYYFDFALESSTWAGVKNSFQSLTERPAPKGTGRFSAIRS